MGRSCAGVVLGLDVREWVVRIPGYHGPWVGEEFVKWQHQSSRNLMVTPPPLSPPPHTHNAPDIGQ